MHVVRQLQLPPLLHSPHRARRGRARAHNRGAELFSFRAFASRFSALRKGAKIAPNFAACTKCGLVWGQVSTNALHDHLETLPTGEMKQWLKSAHDTPI